MANSRNSNQLISSSNGYTVFRDDQHYDEEVCVYSDYFSAFYFPHTVVEGAYRVHVLTIEGKYAREMYPLYGWFADVNFRDYEIIEARDNVYLLRFSKAFIEQHGRILNCKILYEAKSDEFAQQIKRIRFANKITTFEQVLQDQAEKEKRFKFNSNTRREMYEQF